MSDFDDTARDPAPASAGSATDAGPGARGHDPLSKDERQAPLIGHYLELSLLTALQIRILVTIWIHGDFEESVRSLPSWRSAEGGIEVSGEVIEGRGAVDAVTMLLSAGYLARGERGYLSMTARGRRLADLASQSARTMHVVDSARGHA